MDEYEQINDYYDRDQQLREWYRTPLGNMLAEDEQAELDAILPDMFGYHLMQIGSMAAPLLSASRILHKFVLDGESPQLREAMQIAGAPEQLPIQADCLDAVILHHSLELVGDPRQLLREVERTLVPEGHLVVLGFNPLSLWGLRRFFKMRRKVAPWDQKFLSVNRITDWMALLGMEVTHTSYRFFRLPYGHKGLAHQFRFLESWGQRWWPIFGGVYFIVAKKKVSTLTPIKPRWRPQRSLVRGLSDAASRSSMNR
jgi:SAM-dependent methyltransferase